MFLYLFALFIVVPFVELVLLLWLADQTSWQLTILLVLVTGVVGSVLARRQGLGIWLRVHRQIQHGEIPGRDIMDGVLVLIAGAFLITPGIITDGVGLLLLVPWTRGIVRGVISKWAMRRAELHMKTFVFRDGGSESGSEEGGADGECFESHATRPRDEDNSEDDSDEATPRIP